MVRELREGAPEAWEYRAENWMESMREAHELRYANAYREGIAAGKRQRWTWGAWGALAGFFAGLLLGVWGG